MAKTSRNALCPCGSGKKFKRCCIDRVDELERSTEALREVLALPTLVPRMRPLSEVFDRWCERLEADEDISRDLIEQGMRLLEEEEQRRVVGSYAAEFPSEWQNLCDEAGGVEVAREALLIGAVVAAAQECREVHGDVLEVIEQDRRLRRDPLKAIAIVLHATDLWSAVEADRADKGLAEIPAYLDDGEYGRRWIAAVDTIAERHWTPGHELRLTQLVQRVRRQLPVSGFPRASKALARACDRFEREEEFRRRLGVLLLADSLSWLDKLDAALAA